MEKLKYIIFSAFVFGLVTCNGSNDKKGNDKAPAEMETKEEDDVKNRYGTDSAAASNITNWSKYYDTNMNISTLYGNLEMTEQQIKEYEKASKNYREDWTKKNAGNDVLPSDVQGILLHRDESLRSILTDEQYDKYKEIAQKINSDNH